MLKFVQGTATGIMVAASLVLLAKASGAFAQAQPASGVESRAPVGNAFTYQGRLEEGGAPVSGVYDFEFQLFDAVAGAVNPSAVVTAPDLTVTNGVFSVPLDFGPSAFQGQKRFIEVRVRPGANTGAYTTLPSRQELTPAPYALFAANTWSLNGNAGTVAGTNFVGTVDNVPLELRVNNFVAGRLLPSLSGANVVFGHSANRVEDGAVYATVSGGGPNNEIVFSDVNRATDNWGTVGGGTDNVAGNIDGDPANAEFATIAGGESNFAKAERSTIGGGGDNRVEGESGTVSGGHLNNVYDGYSYIGGGDSNIAGTDNGQPLDAYFAIVVGGENNQALDEHTFIGGGSDNKAMKYFSIVVGGDDNIAEQDYVFIGGGNNNVATGEHAVIGGGSSNTAHGYSVIAGGRGNQVLRNNSFIGGGTGNVIYSSDSVIGGGAEATDGDTYGNRVTDQFGTVGGGGGNMVGNNDNVFNNANFGTIAGGRYNVTNGFAAMIPGGDNNFAQGDYSFAAGRKAVTTSTADGSFAWADSQDAQFTVVDANTFAIRAAGGVGINLESPLVPLDVNGDVRSRGTTHLLDVAHSSGNMDLQFQRLDNNQVTARIFFNGSSTAGDTLGEILFSTRTTGGTLRSTLRLSGDGSVTPGITSTSSGTGYQLGNSAFKWREVYAFNGVIQTSDGRLKKNVEGIEAGLDTVMQLRPVSYEWKEDSDGTRRLGLIAQEVQEVLPGVVDVPEEADGYLGMDYSELIPVLIKAIQEQQEEIASLSGGTISAGPAANTGDGGASLPMVAATVLTVLVGWSIARRGLSFAPARRFATGR